MSEMKVNMKTNFEIMCQLLISSTKELDRFLSQKDIKDSLNKEVWFLFGPSRTGKSTFLLRLKSNKSCDEFVELVKKTNSTQEILEFDGVKIGSGERAVTTVPNIYKFDNLIFDLAGFVDIDKEREEVIALINNSLFSKITTCKIIAMIDLQAFCGSLRLTMRQYYEELVKLFPKDFLEIGLKSCIFVVTKLDVYGKTFKDSYLKELELSQKKSDDEEEQTLFEKYKNGSVKELVVHKITSFATEIQGVDSDMSNFCNHLAGRLILINYTTTDQLATIKKIMDPLKKLKPIMAQKLKFINVVNELTSQGKNNLNEFSKRISNCDDTISRITTLNLKTIRDSKQSISLNIHKINDLNKSSVDTEMRIISLTEESLNNNKIIKESETRLIKLIQLKIDTENNKKAFLEELKNARIIHLTTLFSTEEGYVNKTNIIKSGYKPPDNIDGHTSNLVLTVDEYDGSKAKIIECQSKKDLESLKLNYLYFDGHQGSNSPNKGVEIKGLGDGSIAIKTDLSVRHVVIIAAELKLVNVPYANHMMKYFDDNLFNFKKEKEALEKQVRIKEQRNKEIDDLKYNFDNLITNNNTNKKNLIQDIDKIRKNVEVITDESIKVTGEQFKQLTELSVDDTYKLTNQLGEILVRNKINSEIFDEAQSIHSKLLSILQSQGDTLKDIYRYSQECLSLANQFKDEISQNNSPKSIE